MAKSYKTKFMNQLLCYYNFINVEYNNDKLSVFTNHPEIIKDIDIVGIIKQEKLNGNTKPKEVVQYFTVAPWNGEILPMIAFIWSWGGPWAYIYNVKYPNLSESGSVPYNRIVESAYI